MQRLAKTALLVAAALAAAIVVALIASHRTATLFQVVRWNMLEPTPLFAPARARVRSADLRAARPGWARLGHATVIVSTPEGMVITDPLLNARLLVPQVLALTGPRRISRRGPEPCSLARAASPPKPIIGLRALRAGRIDLAHQRGMKLHFIRPGKPFVNAYCERFKGKLRNELPQRESTSWS
jgi:Integrase core domain